MTTTTGQPNGVDPLGTILGDLGHMLGSWSPDVREEVDRTLGALAIVCATRGAPVHTAAAEFLAVARRMIRFADQFYETTTTRPMTEG